jgi:hypothetical protein
MKTIRIDAATMAQRVARYSALAPLPVQMDPRIPQAARDVVYARKLLSVIGLDPAAGGGSGNSSPSTPTRQSPAPAASPSPTRCAHPARGRRCTATSPPTRPSR